MENAFVIGVSFKNADVAIRSAFSIPQDKQKECYDLAKNYNFKDFVVLSTCNRTEIYADGSIAAAEEIISRVCNQPKQLLDIYKFVKSSEEAVSHIFHVASGLDSQILGDYQVLGQFKDACKNSKENGLLGPVFERMANICIQASKEVKNKTELSKGTFSSSYAAIEILKEKTTEKPTKCLLIGTGKFGNSISKNIKCYLPHFELTISNRTYSTALEIATANGFNILPYEDINDQLKNFEVVILCASADTFIVTAENLTGETKLVLDLSIPQTVDPVCRTTSQAQILDIDTISSILQNSLEHRKTYLPVANQIIYNHIASFIDWSNFYKNRDKILALKKMLFEVSKECPHLAKMDETHQTELVNKTIQSFVLSLKENRATDFDAERIIMKFRQHAVAV